MKKQKNETNARGITLVALTIAVIVLLIIAGATVALVFGQNGVITKAKGSSRVAQVAKVKEDVQLGCVGKGIDNYGDKEIDFNDFKDVLKNTKDFKESNHKIDSLGISDYLDTELTTKEGKFKVKISELITNDVSIVSKIKVNKENFSKYVGQQVRYHPKKDEGGVYRLFYIDWNGEFGKEGTVYLKRDGGDTVTLNPDSKIVTTEYFAKLNPHWWAVRQQDQEHWTAGEKAAACLADPTTSDPNSNQAFKKYFDSNLATAVFGAPSVEMYAKAYDSVPYENRNGNMIDAIYSYKNSSGYTYLLNGAVSSASKSNFRTGLGSLDKSRFNGLYVSSNVTSTWLASPSARNAEAVCTIDDVNSDLTFDFYDGANSLSPVVAMNPAQNELQFESKK